MATNDAPTNEVCATADAFGDAPWRHSWSSSMTLSTRETSAKRLRCDSRTISGSPPFSADTVDTQQHASARMLSRAHKEAHNNILRHKPVLKRLISSIFGVKS